MSGAYTPHGEHSGGDPQRAALTGLLAALSTAAFVVDTTSRIVAVNAAFERRTGHDYAAAVNRPALTVLRPVGRDVSTLQTLSAAIEHGRPGTGDALIQVASGRSSWFRLVVEPVATAPGHALVLLTEVSDHVRATLEAERGRTALRAVVGFAERLLRGPRWSEVLPDALEDLGRAVRTTTVSVVRLGEQGGAVVARWGHGSASPGDPALIGAGRWIGTLPGDQVTLVDEPPLPTRPALHMTTDGQVALVPIDVDDQRWGFMVFDRRESDLTWSQVERLACRAAGQSLAAAVARERREKAIEAERTFVRQVLDGVEDGVCVRDEHGAVVFANRAMHEILGPSSNTLIGTDGVDTWVRQVTSEAPTRVGSTAFEVEHDDQSLLVRSVERRLGNASRQIVVVTDISSRARLEREVKAAAVRAESASAAKTRFLGRVSHELRTPLQVVLGFARLIEMDPATDEVAGYAGEIMSAAHHLERTVADLLDLSGAESGELALSFASLDLAAAVRDAVETLMPVAVAATVRIAVTAPGRPVMVVADGRRVKQVLLNVLGNALKYAPQHSAVWIEVGEDEHGTSATAGIRDEGGGFPEADIDRLFLPFERLSNAGGTDGVGLGLALSRMLAVRMGGALSAANAPEGGASVTLALPLAGRSGVGESPVDG